jgi:hypothetical protein
MAFVQKSMSGSEGVRVTKGDGGVAGKGTPYDIKNVKNGGSRLRV